MSGHLWGWMEDMIMMRLKFMFYFYFLLDVMKKYIFLFRKIKILFFVIIRPFYATEVSLWIHLLWCYFWGPVRIIFRFSGSLSVLGLKNFHVVTL